MIEIRINGVACTCEKGDILLKVARQNGIEIPSICNHEGLVSLGACRVCLCEVWQRGQSTLVSSCIYPITDECEVFTDSEQVQQNRAMVLALLREKAPDSPVIAQLAEKYGAPHSSRFKQSNEGACILCGLCTTVCTALSVGAITMAERGVDRSVSTPYDEAPESCIGCGACAAICPTQCISLTEKGGVRTIWGKEFELIPCSVCGSPFTTAEELQWLRLREPALELTQDTDTPTCPSCKTQHAASLAALSWSY